jgi:hypothetical protein
MSEEAPLEVTPVAVEAPVVAAEPEKLGWKTELPESIRGHEAFSAYKTKTDLWQGHIDAMTARKDLEAKLENVIPKLPENATDEQKAAFRTAIGVPDTPDAYELDIPEGVPVDEDFMGAFKQWAHKAGLPKDAVKGLSSDYNAYVAQRMAEADKAREAGMDTIKKEWGTDFDKNVEITRRGEAKLGLSKDWLGIPR